MTDPARVRRLRTVGWFMVLALLVTSGCSVSGPDGPPPEGPYVVSYSGAAERLVPLERDEQVRDWARIGLASELKLDRNQIVDALYDTTPIRDPSFTDLVEQPTGPGRALFDGTTLHVLVPEGDPHRSRTIGLLLDKQRADAGADPAQVQVHRYVVHPENQTVELTAEPAAPTGEVRAANGWIERRVDQPQGLADFLAGTNDLSRLELRGPEIWATGWRWPDLPGKPVSAEDVSVLQRGYRTDGPTPGFSLDPFPLSPTDHVTLNDVHAAIPDLDPTLAEGILTKNVAGSGYASVDDLRALVDSALIKNDPPVDTLPAKGLPADRVQLWALDNLLTLGRLYSQARYDGRLEGTEVGMTLFATDYVAKDWTSGVGDGVPSKAVPGFVPTAEVGTPPSLCPREGDPTGESGRLWFGQKDDAFSYDPNGVSIGSQATRLFSRSDGPNGTEVEPSLLFGRALRFWDQHYQDVADYEYQYYRLEQIMRWSGALEWLTYDGSRALPQLPDNEIRSDLKFASWYAEHNELKERKKLTLVAAPSGKEAVLPTPSEPAPAPGCPRSVQLPDGRTGTFLEVRGGVSLADTLNRRRDIPSDGAANVPAGPRRAGPTDPTTTTFDTVTHSGTIDQITLGVVDGTPEVTEHVVRTIRSDPSGTSIEAAGTRHPSLSSGGARVTNDTGDRRLETEVQSHGPGAFTFDETSQGVSFDSLKAEASQAPASSSVRQTDLTVQPRLGGRIKDFVERIRQNPTHALDGAPGFQYRYDGPEGEVYRVDDGWVAVGLPGAPRLKGEATEVTTVTGDVRTVSMGVPGRLSATDVSHLVVTSGPILTTFADLLTGVPRNTPVYRGDAASLVGAEPAAPLPGAIPSDARVSFRTATTTGTDSPVAGEKRTWSLVDVPGTTGSGSGGGAGGGGGSGGGGSLSAPALGVGLIVLLTVCADSQNPSPSDQGCNQ